LKQPLLRGKASIIKSIGSFSIAAMLNYYRVEMRQIWKCEQHAKSQKEAECDSDTNLERSGSAQFLDPNGRY
jgi:hypothetical protein